MSIERNGKSLSLTDPEIKAALVKLEQVSEDSAESALGLWAAAREYRTVPSPASEARFRSMLAASADKAAKRLSDVRSDAPPKMRYGSTANPRRVVWMMMGTMLTALISIPLLLFGILLSLQRGGQSPTQITSPIVAGTPSTVSNTIPTQLAVAPTETSLPVTATISSAGTVNLPACTDANIRAAQQPVTSNEEWTACTRKMAGITMVLVPNGSFRIGGDTLAYYYSTTGVSTKGVPTGGEQTIERPFWIDEYEISNAQYGGSESPDLPITNVRWIEASAFCANRGGRLPTEAEWEFAARGPNGLFYPWGNQWNKDNAIFAENSNSKVATVGMPRGTSWVGASDLLGNVEEWTSSLYEAYPYTKTDGREAASDDPSTNRSLRGGSWKTVDPTGAGLRAADRSYLNQGNRTPTVGFRCVIDVK